MTRDMELFFDPETREYVIVSEGCSLKLDEEQFNAIKSSMNGIAHAFQMKNKN